MLKLKAPVLHHAWLPVGSSRIGYSVRRADAPRGILAIRRRWIDGEALIQRLHWRKTICRLEVWAGGSSAGEIPPERASEVGIGKWCIVDAIPAPEHNISQSR